MPKIIWNPAYDTGFKSIDLQHRELIDLLNRLIEAREADDPARVRKVFPELTAYILFHFATEESLLTSSPEYANHRAGHLQEHRTFGEKIAGWQALSEADLLAALPGMVDYLQAWLLHHIQGTDRVLAAILLGRSL